MKLFVVFHKKIHHEFYPEECKPHIILYGVKERQETTMDIMYEDLLPIYEPRWQQLKYNEGSALYHLYANNLHRKYNHIGVCQYDMKILPECIRNIEDTFARGIRAVFYVGFFPCKEFIGGQRSIVSDYHGITAGLASYNTYFNTNFTEQHLIEYKMTICNTFVVHTHVFDKMMRWMSKYFIQDIEVVMHDHVYHTTFGPGHMIEALTGMFLCLEVAQGATYCKLDVIHDHNYRV